MENIWKKLEKDPILLILGIFLCMAGVILSIIARNLEVIPFPGPGGPGSNLASAWGSLTLIGSIMFLLFFLLRYSKVRSQPHNPFRTLTLLGFVFAGINVLFLMILYIGIYYYDLVTNYDFMCWFLTIWILSFILSVAVSIVYVFFHYQKKPVYPPMNP